MLQISEVNYSCCEQLKISSRPIMLFPFDVWKFKLCLLLIVGFLPSQCFAFAQELFQTFRRGINFWSVDISLLLLVWGPKMQVVQDKVQKEKYMIKEIQKYRRGIFWSVDICWRPAVWLQTASCARQRAPVQQPPFSQVLQQENTFSSVCAWFSYWSVWKQVLPKQCRL